MSKFSLFNIFKRKINNKLQSMIDTHDKIEEIRAQYEQKCNNYVRSAAGLIKNGKKLKSTKQDMEVRVQNAKALYERQIKLGDNIDARKNFEIYKGTAAALETVSKSYDSVADQIERVKANLAKFEMNKDMMEAKLIGLDAQINAIKLCATVDVDDPVEFDCDGLIKEVENEIKDSQFELEAKQEIREIQKAAKSTAAAPVSNVDVEFEAEVARLTGTVSE